MNLNLIQITERNGEFFLRARAFLQENCTAPRVHKTGIGFCAHFDPGIGAQIDAKLRRPFDQAEVPELLEFVRSVFTDLINAKDARPSTNPLHCLPECPR